MKVTLKKYSSICCVILVVYFSTKMLWDRLTYNLSEYISILLIFQGCVLLFRKCKRNYIYVICLFLIFTMYVFFNGIFLTDTQHLFRGVYEYIFYGLIFFSILGYIQYINSRDLYKSLKILGYVGVVIAILTFYEYFTQKAILPQSGELSNGAFISGYGYTFRSRVFTRSYLSHGLLMGIISIIEYINYSYYKNKKWLLYSLLCFCSILCTSSRGPLVSTMGGFLVIMYNEYRRKKLSKKTFITMLLTTIFLLIIFYIVFVSDISFNNNTLNYFLNRTRSIFNWSSDAGNVGRIIRWQKYIQYFLEHNIWIGNGIATTGSSGLTSIMGTTESGLIKRLVELGIIGFLLFYSFVILIIKRGTYKIQFKKEENYNLILCSIACIVSIMVDDITLQITEEIMISFYLWYFMAVLFSVGSSSKNERE